ncbi:MAG TPA: two-component sensor histidine kinase [Deltaproteobacteria bacterium]|nr:two-component sensor histidine kinase [Deltaproteobacteria bacterium]
MPTEQSIKNGVRWYKSIEFKIILSVAITTLAVNGFFTFLYLDVQAKHLDETILKNATQLSETIRKSIQYDMLVNRKENAYRIMETIAEQEGIEKVRIYGSEGAILFSTDKGERGTMVDKKAEACYACHAKDTPIDRLATPSRNRIFPSGKGYRILGMINPMYNDRDCSSAECHAHPASQKVLGVIDITMSLAGVDAEMLSARRQTIVFNLMSILSISVIAVISLLVFVGKPVRQLVLGTNRVARGDLHHIIPIDSDDELGHLARSFNKMTESLQRANEEIHDWIRTLEHKVEERTKELKDAQFQLLHTEKLAAVGKIAATVAHEINNPLTGVFTYIKLMERRIEEGKNGAHDMEKFREYLSTMSREVQRTSAIVHNLLDFTRPKEPSRKTININSLVEESLNIVKNKLSISNITVEKEMDPLPDVPADPSQMKQVFINLIINACEAMESGGVLTIKTWQDRIRNKVMIRFVDTGSGISPEHLSHVFDPFYTTKEKGTGLGLAVVYGIITRHNGRIEVKSSPGGGTEMLISLPTG